MNDKSFHLRWNNHLSNLRTLLEFLYNEQSFVDVTLSCTDGMIRAHKLVLSACSPYFDTVFRENPCKHPTVILKGVSLKEMQLIIEYMYVGSVDVPEQDLPSLLQIASELHIKGLVQSKPTNNDDVNSCFNNAEVASVESQKMENENVNSFYPDINNCNVIKNERSEHENTGYNHTNGNIVEEMLCDAMGVAQVKMEDCDSIDGGRIENNDLNALGVNHGGAVQNEENGAVDNMICKICNRTFQNKQNMKRHMQTHSGEKPHRCQFCSLSFLRLSHLQRHHRVHTGERPFACSQCDKQFSRSDKLKQHIVVHHTDYVPIKQQKQRGRPRKASTPDTLNNHTLIIQRETGTTTDDYYETSENGLPAIQSMEQIYGIQSTMNSISAV